MKPETQFFLNQLSRSTDTKQVAIADNCRFDERVASERWNEFETLLLNPIKTDWADWSEANDINYKNKVTVPSTSVPDSFLEINKKAWLQSIVTNRRVVRLEHLERWLTKEYLGFDTLQNLLSSKNVDDQARLANHIENWNRARDGRPSFAAFYDEVQNEADHTDWQDQLRDRLGLGHYDPTKGVTIPVALMRYSLNDIVFQSLL
jgi:hypothetical protein